MSSASRTRRGLARFRLEIRKSRSEEDRSAPAVFPALLFVLVLLLSSSQLNVRVTVGKPTGSSDLISVSTGEDHRLPSSAPSLNWLPVGANPANGSPPPPHVLGCNSGYDCNDLCTPAIGPVSVFANQTGKSTTVDFLPPGVTGASDVFLYGTSSPPSTNGQIVSKQSYYQTVITGLTPNTLYYYNITSSGSSCMGKAFSSYYAGSFLTAGGSGSTSSTESGGPCPQATIILSSVTGSVTPPRIRWDFQRGLLDYHK